MSNETTILTVPAAHDDDFTARWVPPCAMNQPGYFGLLEIMEGGKVVADEWAADADRAQDLLDSFDFDGMTPDEERDPS